MTQAAGSILCRGLARPLVAVLTVLGFVGVLVPLVWVVGKSAGLTFTEIIKALFGML